jgi:hypothetical protein
MSQLKLRFVSDPGHGWLEVPIKVYRESGVKASPYSYKKYKPGYGVMVYLEEDCDASEFVRVMGDRNIVLSYDFVNFDDDCFVRWLDRVDGTE